MVADALMFADDKPIVEIQDMSLRLCGSSRARLEQLWSRPAHPSNDAAWPQRPTVYDFASILAFAEGKPSEAFGSAYEVFDARRKIARLPRPPFAFIDRITGVHGEPFVLQAGAWAEAEVEIPADAWYLRANRQPTLPFSVLLEIALQPCGWLAAYCGSALRSEEDLRFRNLGGQATMHREVEADDVLRVASHLTRVAHSGGMIIEHFDMKVLSRKKGLVYEGTTYFGFFSAAALADQAGVRDAAPLPAASELGGETLTVSTEAPMPRETLPHGRAHRRAVPGRRGARTGMRAGEHRC